MSRLTLIKLGGSLITDKNKPFHARRKVISRLANEICKAKRRGAGYLLIGHGAGSFGHVVAEKHNVQEGGSGEKFIKGIAEVSEAAIRLNRIVVEIFLKKKLSVFPFAPSSFILSENKEEKSFFVDPILKALKIGLLPVVYGDVIIDNKKKAHIFSTERILNLLAREFLDEFNNLTIIQCGDTKGVYDKERKTIATIKSNELEEVKQSLTGSGGIDVTGGMLHKVEESGKLAEECGIKTFILDGTNPGSLKKALLGKKTDGTLIVP